MPTNATTVSAYLKELTPDRRKLVNALRKAIKANLDPAIKEGIQYGGVGYFLPHKVYPAGYHCDPKQPLPMLGIISQKNHVGLYLFCVYSAPKGKEKFEKAWKATGKKIDMGASCVRIKKQEDVAFDVIEELCSGLSAEAYIKQYESALSAPRKKPAAKKKTATKKKTPAKKKASAKK